MPSEFGLAAKEKQCAQVLNVSIFASGPTGTPMFPDDATFRASTSAATSCRILVGRVIGVGLAESEVADTSLESGKW